MFFIIGYLFVSFFVIAIYCYINAGWQYYFTAFALSFPLFLTVLMLVTVHKAQWDRWRRGNETSSGSGVRSDARSGPRD
jgi:membrane protein implicated in regulation of membrane protease activity